MPLNVPEDAAQRRAIKPVVCYTGDQLPKFDPNSYKAAQASMQLTDEVTVPPRDARMFEVKAGQFFRITCTEGSQVGDLNLWNMHDLSERFYSGKTRQLHASHVTIGHRLWSNMPHMRPLATITADSLAWYGFDEHGGSVHDVIGTRCDPYTNHVLNGVDYHYCCHSNLTRALAEYKGINLGDAEQYVHDVLNVFMCTGFTLDTHQYFMKASPVRPGEQTFTPEEGALSGWKQAQPSGYSGTHGL